MDENFEVVRAPSKTNWTSSGVYYICKLPRKGFGSDWLRNKIPTGLSNETHSKTVYARERCSRYRSTDALQTALNSLQDRRNDYAGYEIIAVRETVSPLMEF